MACSWRKALLGAGNLTPDTRTLLEKANHSEPETRSKKNNFEIFFPSLHKLENKLQILLNQLLFLIGQAKCRFILLIGLQKWKPLK